MEIEGHPTQDLITELQARGAIKVEEGGSRPEAEASGAPGLWLFLPHDVFLTGFDEVPE